ncbi:exosortase-associated EpsI family protein [Roseibacillus persicicus]|uniref:exosortase-associated EpsI family protein n=1 Tax=Roseibacillus persicicus TaxID=454148 RepID=UPI00398A7E0F
MNLKFSIRVGLFIVVTLGTLVYCKFFEKAVVDPAIGVLPLLPNELIGYQVQQGEVSKEEKKILPGDTTFIKRVYYPSWLSAEDASLRAISATLIIAGSDSRSLHRPKVCLTAQHWSIEKQEVVSLETSGGTLEVMDYFLSRRILDKNNLPLINQDGTPARLRAHYVYWWIGPDASTASDEERIWLEVWNSIKRGQKERWAYPSVMVWVDDRMGREEARKRAFDFIRENASKFQKSLGANRDELALFSKSLEPEN